MGRRAPPIRPPTVTAFDGQDGWKAISLDPTGTSLPNRNGPWTAIGFVQLLDDGILETLREHGYILLRDVEGEENTLGIQHPTQLH